MSVLLRQPHGFEGILPLLVHRDPLDRCRCGSSTQKAPRTSTSIPPRPFKCWVAGHYYEITGFDELVGLDPSGFPGLAEFRR